MAQDGYKVIALKSVAETSIFTVTVAFDLGLIDLPIQSGLC